MELSLLQLLAGVGAQLQPVPELDLLHEKVSTSFRAERTNNRSQGDYKRCFKRSFPLFEEAYYTFTCSLSHINHQRAYMHAR